MSGVLPVSGGVAGLAGVWAGPAGAFFAAAEDGMAEQGRQREADEARDVRAAQGGDPEAFERLVRRHQDGVAARMWRFTHDRGDLEELVHEVFVEAWGALKGYRGEAPLEHWLSRIATRVGYGFWQRRDRERSRRGGELAVWDGATDAAAATEEVDMAELARAVLGRLKARDRLVLTLLYLEGRSVAEAAELSGWSRTMVKVQAHRARKRLRALLESEWGREEVLGWMR
jgi:RNA polymerase sigma-70 factor (ECF subfamily)